MPDPVRQMRLVVTATDYDEALAFYRDTLVCHSSPRMPWRAGAWRSSMRVAPPSRSPIRSMRRTSTRWRSAATRTPWDSLNARLEGPGDLQLTLFQELADGAP